MKTFTIKEVSHSMGISTRMLRYYEQMGLIASQRREGYAYRIYDEEALIRIRQILLLRKLRIPVRHIQVILENHTAVTAVTIFQQKISELDEELTALSTIRDILGQFIKELIKATALPLDQLITQEDSLLSAIETLSLQAQTDQQALDNLKAADAALSKLTDVRILYLPPATVASAHYIGDEPEEVVSKWMNDFIQSNQLTRRKPDIRHYGFNHPNPIDETGYHGYEAWVTIPPEMEVPFPLVKKQFPGGLYAAHMIPFGSFHEWDLFLAWIMHSERYEFTGDIQDQEHMCGLLEEQLNFVTRFETKEQSLETLQLDLLMPIRYKTVNQNARSHEEEKQSAI